MNITKHLYLLIFSLISSIVYAQETVLTLGQAEHIALKDDPIINKLSAQSQALNDRAIVAGELPDPKFKLGLTSLPIDSFSVDQEPMTQLQAGVNQMLPRGKTRDYQRQQNLSLADVKQAEQANQSLTILKSVRENFLETYYQVQANQIIQQSRQSFAWVLKNTEMHYAIGHKNQQDVVRAQLELSRLDDRQADISMRENMVRAQLSEWLEQAAYQPIDSDFPSLPSPDTQATIKSHLAEHPLIHAEDAQIDVAQIMVNINEEHYKPAYGFDITYSKRFGHNPNGELRADFLSAMVTIELPLFPDKRQDKQLSSSKQQLLASQYTRTDKLRTLSTLVDKTYTQWQGLAERYHLYQDKLLPESELNVNTSLTAYQAGVTDFSTIIRAQLVRLELQLQALRIQVDKAKAQATLLYLSGK